VTEPNPNDTHLKHERVFELKETVKSWDDDYYHPIALRFYDRIVADMLKWMGAGGGSRVLDAGCGPGIHSIRAAKAGCTVHAIDLSTTMLEDAKQRVSKAGFSDKVTFEIADLTALHLADKSYDFAFSWGVVIHIPPPGATEALKNLARIIKPGGRLALYLVNRTAVDNKLESLIRKLIGRPLVREKHSLGNGVFFDMHGEKLWLWHFDNDSLVKLMNESGMCLVKRVGGEFSEIQRRMPRFLRPLFLYANNFAYRFRAPASLAYCNLWVFEKAR
jgi:ubiquinone/menaquinone biosynthesis C-methylase UbiE